MTWLCQVTWCAFDVHGVHSERLLSVWNPVIYMHCPARLAGMQHAGLVLPLLELLLEPSYRFFQFTQARCIGHGTFL